MAPQSRQKTSIRCFSVVIIVVQPAPVVRDTSHWNTNPHFHCPFFHEAQEQNIPFNGKKENRLQWQQKPENGGLFLHKHSRWRRSGNRFFDLYFSGKTSRPMTRSPYPALSEHLQL